MIPIIIVNKHHHLLLPDGLHPGVFRSTPCHWILHLQQPSLLSHPHLLLWSCLLNDSANSSTRSMNIQQHPSWLHPHLLCHCLLDYCANVGAGNTNAYVANSIALDNLLPPHPPLNGTYGPDAPLQLRPPAALYMAVFHSKPTHPVRPSLSAFSYLSYHLFHQVNLLCHLHDACAQTPFLHSHLVKWVPFAAFVVQNIGVQNMSMGHAPLQSSRTVVIVARLPSPLYQYHHPLSIPFLKTRCLKLATFAITFDNTIAPSCSHPSKRMLMMLIFMATVRRSGKQGTRFITQLELFILLPMSTHHTRNYISTTQLMHSIIIKGETQTFVEKSLTPFNKHYLNATLSVKFSYMPMIYCVRSILALLQFTLLLILKLTCADTIPQL